MRDVRAGKTAKDEKAGHRIRIIVKGGTGAAAKGVRDLSAMFSFAVRQELHANNLCAAVKKPADGTRDRFLTLEEVRCLGMAFDALEAEGASPKAVAIMRLWALTGCRRDWIAGLRWAEVDFDHTCLRLADSKTGHSVRPLAGAALALLKSLPREPSATFVFPSEVGSTFYRGTKRFRPKVVARAGLPGVTPHTLTPHDRIGGGHVRRDARHDGRAARARQRSLNCYLCPHASGSGEAGLGPRSGSHHHGSWGAEVAAAQLYFSSAALKPLRSRSHRCASWWRCPGPRTGCRPVDPPPDARRGNLSHPCTCCCEVSTPRRESWDQAQRVTWRMSIVRPRKPQPLAD
jgi:hypothetical protein